MLQVLGLVLPLFGLIAVGYLAARLVKLPIEGLAWLNFFIIYIALPALIYQLLARAPLADLPDASFLVRTTLGTFIVYVLSFALAYKFGPGRIKEATIMGYAGAYGNIGFLGPPLAIAAFGPEAGIPVALVFCLDNSLHFTMAPLLMAVGGERPASPLRLLAEIIQKIFSHPFILATIAGITAAWFSYQPPAPVNQLLTTLSGAAAPCALFAMGVAAALRPFKRIPPDLAYLVPIKLLLHPLIVYLLLRGLPELNDIWLYSAVLLATLPAATNVFVLAQQYGVWEEQASSVVVVSTLFSIVTVTAFLYAAQNALL